MALTQNDIYPSLIGLATKSLGFVRSVSYYVSKEMRWHVNDLPWLTQGAYEFLTSYVARRHDDSLRLLIRFNECPCFLIDDVVSIFSMSLGKVR